MFVNLLFVLLFCRNFVYLLILFSSHSYLFASRFSFLTHISMRAYAETKNDIRLRYRRRHTSNTKGSQFTHKPYNYHLIITLYSPTLKTADFQVRFLLYITPQRYNFFSYSQYKSNIFYIFFYSIFLRPNLPIYRLLSVRPQILICF